jgi:hypothetical protein
MTKCEKQTKKCKWGLRESNKNPIFYTTKKERDNAIKKTKKGAWIINLKAR